MCGTSCICAPARRSLANTWTALLVPEGALYTQNGATGVVVVSETSQNFVPVTVLRQEGGNAYITPVQTGLLTAGQTVRLLSSERRW